MKWYYFVIVILCLIASAFFSMADMVFGKINQERLKKDIEKGNKKAVIALELSQNFDKTISSILLGNDAINILASSVVTLIGLATSNPDKGETIATIIFTVILLIFSEYLPKSIGKSYSHSIGLAIAKPVKVLVKLTTPIVLPVSKLLGLMNKPLEETAKEEDILNEDILTEMVDSIEENGEFESQEAELVRNSIDLMDIQAYEIMTPRVDVFAINKEDDVEEILKDEELYIHSRIPVYEETIDNIVGILPLKALLKTKLTNKKIRDLLDYCYKPLEIPRNHQVLDLLAEFKSSKIHMAVIKDEYGGTEGIITMEDILEEIVGEIYDEQDEIEETVITKENGIFIVDGMMNIDDFFELLEFNEEFDTDYSTVSGLCQELLDRFAKQGDEIDFDKYHFTVLEANKYTVEKLKVEIKEKSLDV